MHANNLKTVGLLAGLGALFVFLGGAVMGEGGLWIGLFFGLALCGGSYWFSDKLAIRSARAQEVSEAEMPQYYAIVRELTERAGMPMPRLYVTPDMQPNAFATGRSPSHAAVAVTQGILQALDWDELRGVLAHEIQHVKNRDILTGSIAAAIAMALTTVARIAMWGTMLGGNRDDDEGSNPIAALVLMLVAPIAAMVIQMAISRSREYEADASAARLLGTGEPLARALAKLERGTMAMPMNVNPAQASAYIANPLNGRTASFARLFSTHPPMDERIERLRSGAWQK